MSLYLLFALLFIFQCRKHRLIDFFHFLQNKYSNPISLSRKYEKTQLCLLKTDLRLSFLQECINFQLIPKFLHFKIPNKDIFHKKTVLEFQISLLKKEKLKTLKTRDKTAYKLAKLADSIRLKVPWLTYHFLNHLIRKSNDKIIKSARVTQDRKIASLLRKQTPNAYTITNLSNYRLSLAETWVLQFGLKAPILPPSISIQNIKFIGESLFYKLKSPALKQRIYESFLQFYFKSIEVVNSAHNRTIHNIIHKLRKNDEIVIVRPDKGQGVVILNKNDYESKLNDIVSDTTKFSPLQLDPSHIIKQENSLRYYLRKYIKPHVQADVYNDILPSGSRAGTLYGLPKTHKPGCPLRPIVSAIGTPQYQLAKFLNSYIQPLVNLDLSVTSSHDFVQRLQQFQFPPQYKLLSLDVTSLFTNVPLTEVINLATDLVYSTTTSPPFQKHHFKKLLEFATAGTFTCLGNLFRQVDGCAMGNPLSTALACLFLGHHENSWLQSAPQHPLLYLRYCDDTFLVVPPNFDVPAFVDHMNSRHHSIKFTYENEVNGSLPFLDVTITKKPSSFDSKVYRKPTFVPLTMSFNATAPFAWKKGLIVNLLTRAHRLCSSQLTFNSEISYIKNILSKNAFPRRICQTILTQLSRRAFNPTRTTSPNNNTTHNYFLLPFHGAPTMKLARTLANLARTSQRQLQFAFSTYKIGHAFSYKDKVPRLLRSNVIYKFTCSVDPTIVYIGRTKRHLTTRLHEHRSSPSAIRTHLDSCNNCNIDFDNRFEVIDSAAYEFQLAIKEAIWIKQSNPSLNTALANNGASVHLQVFN